MPGEKRIRVLLVDDHLILREGLRKLLEGEDDIEVVGDASNGRQAVEMTISLHPSVVVMDIAMPLLNGLDATQQIRKVSPDTRVIILSAHCENVYVKRATEFGASGYLDKQISPHLLSDAIREVQKGATFFCPSIVENMNSGKQRVMDGDSHSITKFPRLTFREREVLQLIAEGEANKQMAVELGISIKTVEKHREHLMQKLGIHETAGLTRYAIEAGIIESRSDWQSSSHFDRVYLLHGA